MPAVHSSIDTMLFSHLLTPCNITTGPVAAASAKQPW